MTGYLQRPMSSSSPAEPEEPLVVLEFASFEDFLEGCSNRICEEGLFLEAEPRERVSSPLKFELRIRDGFRLLRGEGEVVGVHDPLPTSGDAAGLTVRFIHLDKASQKLLPVVLNHYRQTGVPLLDLEAEEAGVEVQITEREVTTEAAPVTLDDLWEEFEVTGAGEEEASEEETPAPDSSPPLLIDVGEIVTTVHDEADDKEAGPAPVAEEESDPIGGLEAATITEESADEAEAEPEESSEVAETREDDDLDLAGVLPTAPGGVIASTDDLEFLPDEAIDQLVTRPRSWEQVREFWLLILMAFLGVLVGLVVYLSYQDGFEWPWSSSVVQGEPASTDLLAAFQQEVPDDPDIIAVLDFEDPSGVEVRSEVSGEGVAAAAPALQPAKRQPLPAEIRPEQVKATNKKQSPARTTPTATLTGVDRITWRESQDETVLTLWGDGPFDTDQLVVFRLDTGTPRQVVKILGISRPFSERNLAVGTSHISAIRTGLHTGKVGQELHVVADLEDPSVRMRRVEPEGSQLHVYFSKL